MITFQRIKDKEKAVVSYKRVVLYLKDGHFKFYDVTKSLNSNDMQVVNDTHRIYFKPSIHEEGYAILNVPECWLYDTIQDYTQVFLYELAMYKKSMNNCKELNDILKQFSLEMLVF